MKKSLFIATSMLFASSAYAVPVTFFDTITAGQASFNSTVTGTGATVTTDTLSGLTSGSSWDMGDYTISNTDGTSTSVYSASTDGSTGQMLGINPISPGPQSGITFTFDNPINALGFEVGDWATCCYLPSDLFISFDGGATQLVGSASSASDNPTYAAQGNSWTGGSTIFIGAIDDTSTFTQVLFYGTGFGEFLTAGGTIHYSTVDLNSVPDPSVVPIPAAALLFGPALLGFMGLRRKAKNSVA